MNRFSAEDARRTEALEARLGLRLAASLTALEVAKPDRDVNERLRFAREQALARGREARRTAAASSLHGARGGTAVMSGPDTNTPWWLRVSSVLPLALLLGGLIFIDHQYSRAQIEAAAEVDAAILADDLPPEAYRDAGFVEYLRSARQ
ncbi:MAG: DUF3619 family protein [Aquincola sp.]|nr:DUF3619 family protein [Aquincola sp.]MDH4288098.1 DUF3619 family protein [Aquincola sp.]MDH5331693.1 DUF3619 family protein [Aquincola sp.]